MRSYRKRRRKAQGPTTNRHLLLATSDFGLLDLLKHLARLTGAILFFLTACGGATPNPTATVSISPQPSESASASAPRLFTLGLVSPPGSLDPAQAVDESALLITRHLYEGLVAYAPGTTRVVPALAESWNTSDDGLTWTFHLRPNARFSDGSPLTAEEAARNFERWLNRTPPGDYTFWRLMFGGFAGDADENGAPLSLLTNVTAPDTSTLRLTLQHANAALLNTLAMPSFALVSPKAFAGNTFGTRGAASAGTGPFILQGWTPEGIIHLIRNSTYWGAPPQPDELIFKAIPDDTQRLLALQTGEIEGLAHLNPKDYAAAGADSNLRVAFDPALNVLYLGFNQAHAPWGNLDCRLAVAYALNKTRYIQDFFPGDAEVALAMQPPTVWGYPVSPSDHTYDPAQAKQHWQTCLESKVKVPEQITFYVPPIERSYLPDPAGLGAAIQADLAAIVITVQIASPDWQTSWLPNVHSGRADLFLLGSVGVNGDPDGFLCPLFCGAEGAFNSDEQGLPLPPDPELAALLASARSTSNSTQREALYAQAHDRIFESVPAVPLAHRKTAWAYRANVRGNIPSPIEDVFFNLTFSR